MWAKDKSDIGKIRNMNPVVVTPKGSLQPKRAQFPLPLEALEGIAEVHASLLECGAISEVVSSPVNFPILPVRKASRERCFVEDLRF